MVLVDKSEGKTLTRSLTRTWEDNIKRYNKTAGVKNINLAQDRDKGRTLVNITNKPSSSTKINNSNESSSKSSASQGVLRSMKMVHTSERGTEVKSTQI